MESRYEVLTSDINFQPKVNVSLQKLQQIFDYYGEILYRKERYFVEFVFVEYIFNKNSTLPMNRANKRVKSEIRYGFTKTNQMIITIERFDSVFVSDLSKSKAKFF